MSISDDEREIKNHGDQLSTELVGKMLWILVPVVIGGVVTMFTSLTQEMQIVIWGVMALIVMFGLWMNRAKDLRRKREEVEQRRWDKLEEGLDERWSGLQADLSARFDKIDARFDEVDKRFDLSENSDRTLLRNELVKMHREWVEEKGYITLETLEYVDRIHDAYNDVDGNGTGDQLWKDLHNLPIREGRVE